MIGFRRHASGLAAEEQIARIYRDAGAKILGERVRMPEGELDLVVLQDGILIFVEVKRRASRTALAEAVTEKQWQRLANAATRYMMLSTGETGPILGCRFDLALVGPDGSAEIIKNARSFEQY